MTDLISFFYNHNDYSEDEVHAVNFSNGFSEYEANLIDCSNSSSNYNEYVTSLKNFFYDPDSLNGYNEYRINIYNSKGETGDYSIYRLKNEDETSKVLILENVFTYLLPEEDGVRQNIVLDLDSLRATKMVEDNRCQCCYPYDYDVYKVSSDEGNVIELKLTPTKYSDAKDPISIKIRKMF